MNTQQSPFIVLAYIPSGNSAGGSQKGFDLNEELQLLIYKGKLYDPANPEDAKQLQADHETLIKGYNFQRRLAKRLRLIVVDGEAVTGTLNIEQGTSNVEVTNADTADLKDPEIEIADTSASEDEDEDDEDSPEVDEDEAEPTDILIYSEAELEELGTKAELQAIAQAIDAPYNNRTNMADLIAVILLRQEELLAENAAAAEDEEESD